MKEHGLVKQTRARLKEAKPDIWGCLYAPKGEALGISVSKEALERSLAIMNTYICAWEKEGWKVFLGSDTEFGTCIDIDGETVSVRIKEKLKQLPNENRILL